MDPHKILAALHEQLKHIDEAIAIFEGLERRMRPMPARGKRKRSRPPKDAPKKISRSEESISGDKKVTRLRRREERKSD
jgi:hypothetical protein